MGSLRPCLAAWRSAAARQLACCYQDISKELVHLLLADGPACITSHMSNHHFGRSYPILALDHTRFNVSQHNRIDLQLHTVYNLEADITDLYLSMHIAGAAPQYQFNDFPSWKDSLILFS